MSRLTPQPWKKLKRVLELAGFQEERTSGDHICMVKAGVARPIVIPKNNSVGLDIILANIKDLHVEAQRPGVDVGEVEALVALVGLK